ncbi:MAG: TetR family transcriptional regulator [Lapillicoccus sp.]
MTRWQPGATERLQAAALDLFATQGFDQTTTAEIAGSVGLTERTFFRHFSDKREVLFFGQDQLVRIFLEGVEAAPTDASPLEVVAAGVQSAAGFFADERRSHSRMRQTVIEQNPALQEREQHKLRALGEVVGRALRVRGVTEPAATLAAESGITIFGVAFAQWIDEGEERSFATIAAAVFRELVTLTTSVSSP